MTGAVMAETTQAESVPRWAWKLLYRLNQMQKGRVYRLTFVCVDDEPSWVLEEVSKLENWRANG